MAVLQADPPISAQERRLRRAPYMLAVTTGLLWLAGAAESQTVLPLLSTLEKQYHLSATQGAWTISIIGVVSAAVLATLCRAADVWGVRPVMLVSMATIIVGNVLSAIAPGATLFLIGRGVAGFTAATPLLLTVFRLRSTSNKRMDKYMGVLTAAQGFGLVLSFLLGGLILKAGGTARDAIWVIVALGVIIGVLIYLYVPDSSVRARVKLDYIGSILVGAGLALFVVAIGEANTWGWGSGTTLGMLAGGIVVLIAWGLWELRSEQPMVDLRVVAKRTALPAFGASALIAMLGTCNTLAVSQYVETPRLAAGYGFTASVLMAGVILVPVALPIVGGGLLMEPVIRRFGQRTTAIAGALLACADFLWFSFSHSHEWEFPVELFIFGVGFCITSTAANSAYMRGARLGEGGMVAGSANLVAIAFQSLGPTLFITIITASAIAHTPIPAPGNYDHAWLMMAGFALLAAICGALIRNSKINQTLAPHAEVTDVPGDGLQLVAE